MRYFGEVKPSLDELLKHYGTKGMKWGVRKKKYASEEIHAARARQNARLKKYMEADDQAALAKSKKAAAAAIKKRDTIAKEFDTSEDRVTAMHMTRGEKVAHVLLVGPLDAVTIPANKLTVRSVAKRTDKARQTL